MSVKIEAASITDKGLNPRYQVNEDSCLVMEKERVFAVADGVGGAYAGEIASSSALKIIGKGVKQFSQTARTDSIDFLRKLIQAGNEAVRQIAAEKNKQLASTLAIMVVQDTFAVLGHVGDSRIYLARDGKMLQLTRDHSKLQELLENHPQLSLTRAEYRDGHVITRALGVERDVRPDIQKVILKKDDVFLLCTDGIYVHNTDAEMLETVIKHENDLKKICVTLKKNCYDRGAKDNLTAIALRILKRVGR